MEKGKTMHASITFTLAVLFIYRDAAILTTTCKICISNSSYSPFSVPAVLYLLAA